MEQEKLKKIQRETGSLLYKYGLNFLKGSFNPDYKVVTSGEFYDIIKNKTGIGGISLTDFPYRLTDLETIKKFLDINLQSKTDYIENYNDCDNYAFDRTLNAGKILGINSFGSAWCIKVKRITDGKEYPPHWTSVFATKDGKVYAYDNLFDEGIVELNGNEFVIGRYKFTLYNTAKSIRFI